MSLAGLRYQSTTFGTAPQETKSGSYIERSPVVGRGDEADPQSTAAAGGETSDPGSPEDGRGGRDGQESEQQDGERQSDYASPRAAPSFPGSVDGEQLSGEVDLFRAELVQKVLEGLRGDAYLTAQDLGIEALMRDGGIEALIHALKRSIFILLTIGRSQRIVPCRPTAEWPPGQADRGVDRLLCLQTTLVAPSQGA
eukprot:s140_g47.t1